MAVEHYLAALREAVFGIYSTLSLSTLAFALGLVLGSLLLLGRVFAPAPVSWMAAAYVEAFRGTPLLVQIFIIYFGLAQFGLKFTPFWAGVLALGLNSAAYQAEILRAAVQAIPTEQYLTAEAYAFARWQAFRYVILPQALRVAVPALMNELVILIKDSSLVSVIGITPPEIFRMAEYYAISHFTYFEAYTAAATVYLAICYTAVKLSHYIERKYAIPGYFRRGVI